ncbi:MAG TPA: hypothetical protein VMV60_08870 [Thermoanaerobaculia bacterium]|nr:hypothetical protein [Thermoanaerobaculia bacterium]
MLADVLALVLLQLAAGVLVFTLLTPSRDLSGGFFALHGGIAAACLSLAWLVSGQGGFLLRKWSERGASAAGRVPGGGLESLLTPEFLLALAVGGAVAATLVARVAAPPALLRSKKIFFLLSAFSSFTLLISRTGVEPFASRPALGAGWLAAGLVLGALLFGGVIWAMNLGHWYLVSKSLPFGLLVSAAEAFALLALARTVLALVALGWLARTSHGPAGDALADLVDPMRDGFFFGSRVLWGLAAPLVLAPFVVKTARMKSNQAATGLLYVAVVFVLVGELLAGYLTLRSGLPV